MSRDMSYDLRAHLVYVLKQLRLISRKPYSKALAELFLQSKIPLKEIFEEPHE